MHFDLKLWRLTAGLRDRISWSVLLGLASLCVGIARFAFLGRFLAGVFRGDPWGVLIPPLLLTAGAILLRSALDHARTTIAHNTAARVQEVLRARLFDKILALGPAWFGAERTGGVMLSMVDGVEQLQTFFGQYLPQVAIATSPPSPSSSSSPTGISPSPPSCWAPRYSPYSCPRRSLAKPNEHPADASARLSRSAKNSSTRCKACRH